MKLQKLPSGSYRVQKMVAGKSYSITFDHKPSKFEVEESLAQIIVNPSKPLSMSLKQGYRAYMDMKSNVLSPSTIAGYESKFRQVPEYLQEMKIQDIDNSVLQKFVNNYSVGHAPKTVRCLYNLLTAILGTYNPNMNICVTLPQKRKIEPYIPTEEDVLAIMRVAKGTKYEVPLGLAMMGLRKSEIIALTIDDLEEDNTLHINKAIVLNKDNEFVQKTTKTEDSTRDIVVPDYIANLIREQGYIYQGYPNQICKALQRFQKQLGIQQFSLHKMRHFFASYAHNELHLSDKQIQKAGGWSSDHVMKTVYTHAMKQDQVQKELANNMNKFF